jgi:membrane protein YdbS with pleckstrin-like domain
MGGIRMSENGDFRVRNKFWLQAIAFFLIALPPIALYFSVAATNNWATWTLMLLIAVGMIVEIWVS